MNRNFILVLSALFTWGLGDGLYYFFQPLYLQQFDSNIVLIGSIMGVQGLAMALFQIPVGYLTERFSDRNVMRFGWTIGMVSVWIMAFAKTLPIFIVGIILYGFSVVSAATTSLIIRSKGKLSIERAMTLISAAYNGGTIIGPIIGGWIGEKYGLNTIYHISAMILMVSASITYFITKSDDETEQDKDIDAKQKMKFRPNKGFILLLSALFFTFLVGYMPEPLTPNFLQNERGLSLTTIGQLGSIGSLGNTIIALAIGSFSAIKGLMIAQVFVGLYVLLLWKGTGFPLLAAAFLLKGGFRTYRAMFIALAHPLIKAKSKAVGYGYIATINSIAIFTAPTIAGILYAQKPEYIYIFSLIGIVAAFTINSLFLPRLTKQNTQTTTIEEPVEI